MDRLFPVSVAAAWRGGLDDFTRPIKRLLHHLCLPPSIHHAPSKPTDIAILIRKFGSIIIIPETFSRGIILPT